VLEDQLDEAVGKATVVDTMNPARSLLIGPRAVVDDVTSATDAITAVWGPLLDKVKRFTEIVDKASEVWLKRQGSQVISCTRFIPF
jgi:uncharacterized protein YjcR